MKKSYLLFFLLAAFSSCSLTTTPESKPDAVVDKVGCSSYEYYLIKELNRWLIQQNENVNNVGLKSFNQDWLPSLEKNPRYQALDEKQKLKLKEIISSYLNYLISVSPKDPEERKQFLASLALGDESDDRRKEIQQKLQAYEKQMLEILPADSTTQCGQSEKPGDGPFHPAPKDEAQVRLEESMKRLLATTYQSCQVLNLKPLHNYDDLVQGIKSVGQHPGGGQKRIITSVDKVSTTHYYIKGQSYAQGCFQVSKNPLIYDFGGRPAYTSDAKSKLNFFKNSGSGTNVLGYDCSALVYSVLMNAGLKMSTDLPFVAEDIDGAYSGHFLQPGTKQNCIEDIVATPNENLMPGDIVAMDGHVLMIYKVGGDPLAISSIKTREQCANIPTQNFDFQVLQSSASKGGIGVNVFEGSDYINSITILKKGFTAMAQQSCYSKFDQKKYKFKVSGFSLVRHKKTAACQSRPIEFEKSSCVESCL